MGLKNNDIDLSMDIILVITPEGFTWSRQDIADVCGCNSEYIREIEKKALNKLQHRSVLRDYTNGGI